MGEFTTIDAERGFVYFDRSRILEVIADAGFRRWAPQEGLESMFKPYIVFWNDDDYADLIEQGIMLQCELENSKGAIRGHRKLPHRRFHEEYYKLFLQPRTDVTLLEVLRRTLNAMKTERLLCSGKVYFRNTLGSGDHEAIVLYQYPKGAFNEALAVLEKEFRGDEERCSSEKGVLHTRRVSPLILARQGGAGLREEARECGNLDFYFHGENHWLIRETALANL